MGGDDDGDLSWIQGSRGASWASADLARVGQLGIRSTMLYFFVNASIG